MLSFFVPISSIAMAVEFNFYFTRTAGTDLGIEIMLSSDYLEIDSISHGPVMTRNAQIIAERPTRHQLLRKGDIVVRVNEVSEVDGMLRQLRLCTDLILAVRRGIHSPRPTSSPSLCSESPAASLNSSRTELLLAGGRFRVLVDYDGNALNGQDGYLVAEARTVVDVLPNIVEPGNSDPSDLHVYASYLPKAASASNRIFSGWISASVLQFLGDDNDDRAAGAASSSLDRY